MKQKKTLIIVLLVLLVLVGAASILYDKFGAEDMPEYLPEENQDPSAVKAPDFTVYDLEGNAVSLSDYVGTPVVLNFWASWCGPCKAEMPHFDEKYMEHGDEVQFLMVNLTGASGETVTSASDYVEASGYSFPVLFDTDRAAQAAYAAYAIPVTYFIDSSGSIVSKYTGTMTLEALDTELSAILP